MLPVRIRATVAVLLALCVVLVGTTVASALSPNQSIFLYKPGKAQTGVLKADAFVRKRSFAMSGVTHAAASRSTLALYNKATGKLRTGTFRSGVYTPVETITIRSGFTHVAASCDSILFYSSVSGRLLTGTLIGGRFRNASTRFVASGWMDVAASCDTAWFVKTAGDQSTHELGVLVGGDYTKVQDDTDGARTVIAMTDTSWVALKGTGLGDWGPVSAGARTFDGDYSTTFSPWDAMTGTASFVLFTMSSGESCIWRLVDGEATQAAPCSQLLPAGLTVTAGGR